MIISGLKAVLLQVYSDWLRDLGTPGHETVHVPADHVEFAVVVVETEKVRNVVVFQLVIPHQ